MKIKFSPVLFIASFLIQSCSTTPSDPPQVDFNQSNIQHTWTMDKISYYNLSDVETSSTTIPAGYYFQTYESDDSVYVTVTGSGTMVAHYQLGTYLGKNIIIYTTPTNVDTVEVTSITANTLVLNTKTDVSGLNTDLEYEIDYLKR